MTITSPLTLSLPQGTASTPKLANSSDSPLSHPIFAGALVLTIDPAYFALTGGLERWLYRLVRKHGGKQKNGWSLLSTTAEEEKTVTMT